MGKQSLEKKIQQSMNDFGKAYIFTLEGVML